MKPLNKKNKNTFLQRQWGKKIKRWLRITRSAHSKAGVILALTILYAATFKPLTERYGVVTAPISAIPVVLAGWFFGLPAGLIAGVLAIPLNGLLYAISADNGWALWAGTSWAGNIMVVLTGYIAGLLKKRSDERERAQSKLRASEARYRAIVEDQTELVCRMTPDGRMTFANQSYLKFFGKTLEQVIGSSIAERDVEGQSEMIKSSMAILGSEQPALSFDEYLPQPDGSKRWVQWVDHAIFKYGKVIEIQAVGREITARKQAEDNLIRSKQQLSEAQSRPALLKLNRKCLITPGSLRTPPASWKH